MTIIHTPKAREPAAANPPHGSPQPDDSRELTEVLFPEAKRRERLRRLRVVAVLLLVVAVGLLAVFVGGSGNGPGTKLAAASPGSPSPALGSGSSPAGLERSVSISPGDLRQPSGSIGVVNGKIVVGLESYQPTSRCGYTTINPTTMRVLSRADVSCDDPRVYGESIEPIEFGSPRSNYGTVRIARVISGTGKVLLGAPIMTYPQVSDERPEWAYGPRFLWLFDAFTPKGAEVLRISLATGAVLSSAPMPPYSRLTLAADENGLWIASGSETLSLLPSQGPASPLFFLGNTAKHAIVVDNDVLQRADWLVAFGSAVFVGIQTQTSVSTSTSRVLSYSSPPISGKPSLSASRPEPDRSEGPSIDDAPVVAIPGVGLVNFVQGRNSELEIDHLDPVTDTETSLAKLNESSSTLQGEVVVDGALYALSQPIEYESSRTNGPNLVVTRIIP